MRERGCERAKESDRKSERASEGERRTIEGLRGGKGVSVIASAPVRDAVVEPKHDIVRVNLGAATVQQEHARVAHDRAPLVKVSSTRWCFRLR